MKNNIVAFHSGVILRAGLVILLGGAAALITGAFLRLILNRYWIYTGNDSVRDLFQFFSGNQAVLVLVGILVLLLLFSNWILRPVFDSVALLIRDHIQISGDRDHPVRLPRDMKQLEDELNRVSQEARLWRYALRDAEQRKDDLVVYLAHDLRTPLTSVLGYLDLLAENPDLPLAQRERFIETALRKAGRMQTLVEELFEITRFNVGQLEPERTDVNIQMMVQQLLEEMMPTLDKRGLTACIENDGLHTAFIDAEKMARALDNVLNNAASYAKAQSRIRVRLWKTEGGRAAIAISNTGSDIPQEKLTRIFEKFYRGDEARQSGTGGAGLGLAIAKQIIEAHGGDIRAENADCVTTFTITL